MYALTSCHEREIAGAAPLLEERFERAIEDAEASSSLCP
jgi:hypothetical protein